MLRKLVCAAVVLALGIGVTLAEEIRGVITKVDGDKVTFHKVTFNKDQKKLEKGDDMTLPVADGVKVTKIKSFDKDTKKAETEDVKDGLKNEMFSKMDEKGLGATIVTDDDGKKIKEIRVGGFGGGFKKKKGAN